MSNDKLRGNTISDTYPSILQINGLSDDSQTAIIEDGLGNISPLTVYKKGKSNSSIKVGNLTYPTQIFNNQGVINKQNKLTCSSDLKVQDNNIVIKNIILPQTENKAGYVTLTTDGSSITSITRIPGDLQIHTLQDDKLLSDLHNIGIPPNAKIYQIWLMGYTGDEGVTIKHGSGESDIIVKLNKRSVFYDILNIDGYTSSDISMDSDDPSSVKLYITQISYVKE